MTILRTSFFIALSSLVLVAGAFYAPSASGQSTKKREQWKPAVLEIVTNFEKADVKVNGMPYVEYRANGEPEGMVLPAGGPYTIEVTYEGNVKTYRVNLRAYETRLMILELSGMQGGTARGPAPKLTPRAKPKKEVEKKEDDDEKGQGRVTVYSKPKGTIMIDGGAKGEQTPGTVDVEPGRHEVQVRFESGDESEKKIIRVRKGSRIKLFFREKK
jgi:hypothetical protein